MDKGVIQALKLKYRKRQLQFMIAQKEKTLSGSEILKKISVLEAIYWINRSWREVEASTIEKCFRRCGFQSTPVGPVVVDEDDILDDIPLSVLKLSNDVFGVDFTELLKIDSELLTHSSVMPLDWSRPAGEILHPTENNEVNETECDSNNNTEEEKVCGLSTALLYIEELKAFVAKNGKSSTYQSLMNAVEDLVNMVVEGTVKQTSIKDFFK